MIEFVRDVWSDGWVTRVVFLFVAALGGALILSAVDVCWANQTVYAAVVVERTYKPSETNVGTGVGAKGQVVTVITSSSEQWNVVVRYLLDGRVEVVTATKDQWASISTGSRVWVVERNGKLLGVNWGRRIQ